jgi:signal transduction histidine kinase
VSEASPPPPVDAAPATVTQQLVRRVVVPLLVGFLLFLTPLVALTVRDARSQPIQAAEVRAAAVALLAQDVIGTGTSPQLLAELPPEEGEQLGLLGLDGRQVAGTAALPESVRTSPPVAAALEGEIEAQVLRGEGLVVGAAPVVTEGRVVGVATSTRPTAAADARIRRTLLLLAALSTGLLVVAVLAGRAFARTIVRPIAELDRVAGELAAGHLDARAPVDAGPPELRRLASTLNRSVGRLQELLEQQRRFVADASHQLRTPLTGLRLRLEIAEAAGEGDPGRLRAALEEVDRLSALVGDLLLLARAEEDRPAPGPVDVVGVAEERVATWALVGQDQHVEVRGELPSTPLRASALPGALEQVLDNLLANAVRAAPRDSTVTVSVTADDDGEVVCRVTDHGAGLSADERARAFDRFWRAPGSGPGGSGLGLAIVRELTRASGGEVALLAADGGGTIAEVRLPRT